MQPPVQAQSGPHGQLARRAHWQPWAFSGVGVAGAQRQGWQEQSAGASFWFCCCMSVSVGAPARPVRLGRVFSRHTSADARPEGPLQRSEAEQEPGRDARAGSGDVVHVFDGVDGIALAEQWYDNLAANMEL